ncbi:hypothetical protein D621_01920 [beta proteobacterium AAP51]|nr:hypothetical protein D621_01920 [beta proteobacterium AAP51]
MAPPSLTPLSDADIQQLESQLDALPEPLQPLDISALDGYLCGVLLQPRRVAAEKWQRFVVDVDGQPAPGGPALNELQALVLRRHAEIDAAIAQRAWFDPWVYQLDDADDPSESLLPWVAGFAAAMDHFPALMDLDAPELVEPLALVYMHFPPEDLEDADALLEVIETLEPPADLPEAVQDLVRALMLMADVTRPRAPAPRLAQRPAPRRGPPRRLGGGPRGR